MTVDFFLAGTLAFQLLEVVAVPDQLKRLAGGEQQHQHQHRGDAGGAPELSLPLLVNLSDDGIVPDVFLDRVFEIEPTTSTHASLSIARSLALRARGLRSSSAGSGTSGRLVSMRSARRP